MMCSELTILLVEDDMDTCNAFQNYVQCLDDIRLIGITNSAYDALTLVQSNQPDVILLDLELHQGCGNGMFFLLELQQLSLPHRPYILITTYNVSQTTFETARHLGADFILCKYEIGYSVQYVIDFIYAMKDVILAQKSSQHSSISTTLQTPQTSENYESKIRHWIQNELTLIGISPKVIGFQYLIDAIFLINQNNDTHQIHSIAQKYKKSDASVERAMQNAINRAWRTNDPDILLKHYTAVIRSDRGVPTLMEFIYYYVTQLKNQLI